MLHFFLVASGGASGALLRFLINNIFRSYLYNSFYITLFINIVGSFLIGYIISLNLIKNLSEDLIKYFFIIGFLGSFTTFSAFSFEVVELILSQKIILASFYIFLSIFLCIVAAYLGMYINKIWLKLLKLRMVFI